MKTLRNISAIIPALLLLTGCDNGIPTVSLGIDDAYYVARMQKLDLHPALTGAEYRWTMTRPDGSTAQVSTARDYIFLEAEEGTYTLHFEIIDTDTPYEYTFSVNVMHEEVEYSPYISRVYEYCPAP